MVVITAAICAGQITPGEGELVLQLSSKPNSRKPGPALQSQNVSFKAIWISRGVFAWLLTTPKVELPSCMPAMPNLR